MLVTQTWREVVSVLPRFRIMAVSMKRLQIRRARIAVLAIDMVHLDAVVMLEVQPTVTTPALLRCAGGQDRAAPAPGRGDTPCGVRHACGGACGVGPPGLPDQHRVC